MKCYLYSKELRKREGKPSFFVCKWVGILGDPDVEKTNERDGKTFLNIKAVQARQINITKSIFPTTDNEVTAWNKILKAQYTIKRSVDNNGNEVVENKENNDANGNPRQPKDCVWANLVYTQVPLCDISSDVRQIRFENSSGKVLTQNFITVIGIADENDKWAESQTPEEMAKANLATNLASGVYIDVTDEVEEVESTTKKEVVNEINGTMKTVKLITCEGVAQAHIIQRSLKNANIVSLLHNENISTVVRGHISQITKVDILVYEENYNKAIDLLERNQMIPEQLKYCPNCGASDIKFILKHKRQMKAMIATILSILVGTPLDTDHWEYVCKKCGAHFEKPVARLREDSDGEKTEE